MVGLNDPHQLDIYCSVNQTKQAGKEQQLEDESPINLIVDTDTWMYVFPHRH